MLFTLSTTHQPATDLGYLLYKHPGKVQSIELSAGQAHVFYPEASETRCTVALLLDIDPVGLVRKNNTNGGEGFALEHYVNDRPYTSSSFMTVALSQAFSTAMNGTCKDKPELVNVKLPFEATFTAVPVRGGENLIRRLFEPLGYEIEIENYELDTAIPEWGMSRYFAISLKNTIRLQDLLSQFYILLPVLTEDKHYFISKHEVEKLLEKGRNWLPAHPEKEFITRRYLKNLSPLTHQAFEVLMQDEPPPESNPTEINPEEKQKKISLHTRRLELAFAKIKESGAKTVADLGCGEGRLLQMLLKDSQFEHILGMDVSHRSLALAAERLHQERLSEKDKSRLTLIQGSLTYRDKRLSGFDAAALVEVIEHLDENRLLTLEKVVFGEAKPKMVVVTTPNADYNQKYESLAAGSFRHEDHRFEWTQEQFQKWATHIQIEFQYKTEFFSIGEADERVGAASQGATFIK